MSNTVSVSKSHDLDELCARIRGLIGKKCWKLAFTYGGELSLHFGRHIAYHHPKMAGKTMGEWRLDTRATPWMVFTPDGTVSSKDRKKGEKEMEGKLKVLEGRKVTNVNVSVPDCVLTIALGNEYLFRVTPTNNNARSSLAYWKLLMPDRNQITYGPGLFWESLMRQAGASSPEECVRDVQILAGIKAVDSANGSLARKRKDDRAE